MEGAKNEMFILFDKHRERHGQDVHTQRREDFLLLLEQVREEPAEARQRSKEFQVGKTRRTLTDGREQVTPKASYDIASYTFVVYLEKK